jgi:hypothetical protein
MESPDSVSIKSARNISGTGYSKIVIHETEREHNGKCTGKKQLLLRTIIIHKQSVSAIVLFRLSVPLFLACNVANAAHRYTVAIDADYTTMTVEAHFDRAIDSISARSRHAGNYLRNALDCTSKQPLRSHSQRLVLPAAGIRCLRYSVDLRGAAQHDRFASILNDRNLAASPTLWLWRPRLLAGDEIFVTFALADDGQVFVPWQRLNAARTEYRLTASPQSGAAIALFGDFEQTVERLDGATLNIALLSTGEEVDLQTFVPWVRATARNVMASYGRFPNPNTSVVLIATGGRSWGSDKAVSFGQLVRDGGETIELMINQHRPVSEFYKEWTPTHEFSHLMLPYVNRDQRWIPEGFAQYYQNVLLARAGQYSPQDAWQRIYSGLERGRESAPGISPNDAASGRMRGTRMKIYWSGAALALMADVELRRRSKGAESLDTVLGQLQSCCLPSAASWSGEELFGKLDEFLQQPLFMDLYRQYADADGFPDARPLLARLGIGMQDGHLALQPDAELAYVRDAITRQATEPH